MFHTLQTLLTTLASGVWAHLDQWIGWSALVAGALFGFSGSSWRLPLLVAIVINPMPYAVVAGLFNDRSVSLNAVVVFTLVQGMLAYAGCLAGRMATRLR